jgi:predicted CopG family antitoxin
MAAKTIPLDEEAYEILNRRKQPGQSFSQVIKMHLGEHRHGTAEDLLRKAERYVLSEDTLDAIEEQIRLRS